MDDEAFVRKRCDSDSKLITKPRPDPGVMIVIETKSLGSNHRCRIHQPATLQECWLVRCPGFRWTRLGSRNQLNERIHFSGIDTACKRSCFVCPASHVRQQIRTRPIERSNNAHDNANWQVSAQRRERPASFVACLQIAFFGFNRPWNCFTEQLHVSSASKPLSGFAETQRKP